MAVAAILADLAGAGEVVTDPDVVEGYRRDQAAPGMLDAGRPVAVVRPRTTAEVQAAVRAAARHRVPVVPRGAGSGLSGGANAIDGCLLVSLERMTGVVAIDAASLTATVEPGVVNASLRAAAAEHGVGVLKRAHLAAELGPDALALQRAVKAAFDPAGLMTPGKAL